MKRQCPNYKLLLQYSKNIVFKFSLVKDARLSRKKKQYIENDLSTSTETSRAYLNADNSSGEYFSNSLGSVVIDPDKIPEICFNFAKSGFFPNTLLNFQQLLKRFRLKGNLVQIRLHQVS